MNMINDNIGEFPESWVLKSEKQILLEKQGCVFKGQELLDNHELDITKKCYCGRPNSQKGTTINA